MSPTKTMIYLNDSIVAFQEYWVLMKSEIPLLKPVLGASELL